ncbi:isopenicillin N synthase family dioxygenase [Sphingomonas montanisoli]|uniref:2-oxoglutarate-dependent ethylene/succinate-forming enzyme n=1 Tax=Sphingomonas montanisoli TaxID=2606412 RepID=A0A5D9C2Y9_9SPHN|nr:2-oxoglutarate and iron-dependent oxygenase domain-containing protein [Sphingomonas montanisoli]TZG26114.1 isopenicillin N synthase family oxygenase [Sphingomonas montanisoli]
MTDIADLDTVPSVSLQDADRDPEGFAQDIGRSFERFGFAVVADHGIPAELIAKAEELSKALFALPTETKRHYLIPGSGGARGYTAFGIETAKGNDKPDLKEFWHVGRDLPAGHKFSDEMAPNVWPDEVPGFRETYQQLFAAFDTAGLRILEAIARYLGLAPDYFVDTVKDGNSVLRLLHYPPIGPDAPGIRAGAHEDINTITLLLGAEEGGLELLDKSGHWIPVKIRQGELVVNIGDMLERLTNKVLPSTSHRVMNPPPERRGLPRYSMPFFLHFRPDFLIETLPETMSEGRPNLFPTPITAHGFLQERLEEIKLI